MTLVPIVLRAATMHDQPLIHLWVRRAKLNPLGLRWQNFLVAERMDIALRQRSYDTLAAFGRQHIEAAAQEVELPRVVGIGQVRPHRDGTQELASLVVHEAVRGQGVGSLLVRALIVQAQLPLYLMCNSDKVPYYARFSFVEVTTAAQVPRALRAYYRLGRVVAHVARLFEREPSRLAIMLYAASKRGLIHEINKDISTSSKI
jgi:N-acetylglutamate synthase-like GNAT family acetyltransferase